ncbi:MAG: YbdK family carboxylate-amine ligase [Actinomycetes bacterium]
MTPGIDFHDAEDVFAASVDGTVGLEEEFAIVDPKSLELVPRFDELRLAAKTHESLDSAIAGELIRSEIEIRSGRGENLAHAQQMQQDHRASLFALAREQGLALAATGTHPWADYRDQQIIDTDHYRRVESDLRWVASRNNTFSLHVHVGVNGLNRAVRVCDRLRHVLPALLAISASSPFLDGRDTGLHSVRTQIFTKSFPRCGIPDAYGSWDGFRRYLETLLAVQSIVEYTQVWWSVRPHLSFGTVEVRICDAQPTAAESDGLAQLITACVLQAARDEDEGVPMPDVSRGLLEENFWRAIRFGVEGKMIDFDRLVEYPGAESMDRLLSWTAPVRAEHGISPDLPALNATQRQRAEVAEGRSIREVYGELLRKTGDTYAPETVA